MSNRHTSFKLDLAPGYVAKRYRPMVSATPSTKLAPRGIVGLLLAAFWVGFAVACAFGYGG